MGPVFSGRIWWLTSGAHCHGFAETYIEVSSKTNTNVAEAIEKLAGLSKDMVDKEMQGNMLG
jgi:hypothetical protein